VDNGINSEGKNNCPWGSRTAKDNNPYTDAPETGITRHYEWNITRRVIAPDGYQKDVILINDQFPGPLLEANWGDWIEVTVHNNIENVDEGTSIHWHGMIQQGTPFMDGVPGVTQCPIPTGGSFTYKFHASLYGSSWYHSHYSAQYSDGLYGPLVIHGPSQQQYDIDVGPILVGDWWHKSYMEVVDEIMAPNFTGRSFSDNNLIQGKMNFNCSTKAAGDNTVCTNNAGLAKFTFTPGKVHRLRLVNTGSQGIERVSIDGHTMTVIANDFTEVEPYQTKVVTLGVGQRTDVLVVADSKDASAFWLRANLTSCSGANQPLAVAAVYYEGADTAAVPISTAWDAPDPGNCANDDLSTTTPLYPIAIPEPSFTHEMDIGTFVNSTGNFLWTFGNVSARVDYNAPTLLQVKAGNLTFDQIDNVIDFGTNTSVRIIVKNPTPA
jgi:FtsP/CotA-like multicopper oxidase with cupredoxin domain